MFPSNAGAVLALKNKQIDGLVVDLPTAFYVTAVQVPDSKILGQFENKGAATDRFGVVLAKGNSLTSCVNKAITSLRAERHAQAAPAAVAGEGDRRADPEVGRRARLLDGMRSGGEGRRSVAVALLSTVVFFALVVVAITHAPGLAGGASGSSSTGTSSASTFPEIARAFRLNIKIFSIAEVFILVFALFLAVLRSLPGPVFFPLRALAIVYADFFRGIPTILVIAILGFGAPGARAQLRPDLDDLLGDRLARARSTAPTSPRSTAPASSRSTRARRRPRARSA